MSVTHPQAFWYLLGLIPLLLLQLLSYSRGRRSLPMVAPPANQEELANVYLVKWFFSSLAFDLFYVFAVLALAGFYWGQRPVEEDRSGMDAVLVVDVSRSMLAADVSPSRMDRSKDIMRGLIGELDGSRFALVVFKGQATRLVPMTEDRAALEASIDALQPDMLSSPGTDVESGLKAALAAFPDGTDSHRIVVLFSDGESLSGSALEAARQAGERGIPVFVVAAGTLQGSAIMLPGGKVLTDAEGRVVISRVSLESLSDIASASGGALFRASDADIFKELTGAVGDFVGRRNSEGFRLEDVARYPLFLSLAIVFLLLHVAIRVVRWKNTF